jgi:dephospho-CoA kinase
VRFASRFRERPEEWNSSETLDGRAYPKRVFAPPVGGRPVNVHVREAGSATARCALLFRDFLRADKASCDTWGEFETRLAQTVTDVYSYGQIKASVQPLLMAHAEEWAQEHSWQP